ncbi:MAG: hypothetical protein AAGI23_09570 [Bacteroidota bacterium]
MTTAHTTLPSLPTYFGGKGSNGVHQTIINEIPAHEQFVSGYLGACSILRHIRPANRIIGIEPNGAVLAHWYNRKCSIPLELELIQGKFLDVLPLLTLSAATYIYLDPPYPLDSRKQARLRYEYEMDDTDHKALLATIKEIDCPVGISTYPNRLYARELKDWRRIEFQATTRRGMATEWFYMNYPKPKLLHDYSYYGKSYHKRQDFKRRKHRLLNKFEAMSEQERNHYIRLLTERYPISEEAALLPIRSAEVG